MKTRSLFLPSAAFQSTPPFTVMAARPAFLTALVFACGMAMPSPTAVLNSASRLRMASL